MTTEGHTKFSPILESLAVGSADCDTEWVAHTFWPLFDLRILTPRLELRYPSDGDIAKLAELAANGVYEQDVMMPFSAPRINQTSLEPERSTLQYYWLRRAEWMPTKWGLPCAVFSDGVIVGSQEIMADDFPIRRVIATASWVGRAYQGRGIGKEMREAILHLAFAGLGTDWVFSSALGDNLGSLKVSRALGYTEYGDETLVREGKTARFIRMRLSRERWAEVRRDDIKIENLEPCLELFGVA